ncbi:hypothetical protein MIND_01374900 [Mycena indigotica]|uniref:Uncharacterized protein n=1 Tax=Mycena indigotica TaxID=2126181 RepID=A0A8H6VPQ7_9AGAR|nr:uncharacterized protein MIND_01374900 [Mycena indigotica]KAF7289139.1 hypothetical protein MIND_01374900 [Mycena indigotica]
MEEQVKNEWKDIERRIGGAQTATSIPPSFIIHRLSFDFIPPRLSLAAINLRLAAVPRFRCHLQTIGGRPVPAAHNAATMCGPGSRAARMWEHWELPRGIYMCLKPAPFPVYSPHTHFQATIEHAPPPPLTQYPPLSGPFPEFCMAPLSTAITFRSRRSPTRSKGGRGLGYRKSWAWNIHFSSSFSRKCLARQT